MKLRINNCTISAMMTALLIVPALLLPALVWAERKSSQPLQFVIPVLPEAERYLDLLSYPPYLAVALENNGITPSNMSRIMIVDGHTVQSKNAFLRFSEKKRDVFIYQARMELEIATVKTGFTLPTEVDTSGIRKGTVTVRIYVPLAKLLPESLIEKIRGKIQSLTGEAVQKKMLAYFNDLEKRRPQGSGTAGMLELILIQGYNSSSSAGLGEGREPGDAEPWSDQVLFLATLGIWLVLVPFAILTIYLWRRFKRGRLKEPYSNS